MSSDCPRNRHMPAIRATLARVRFSVSAAVKSNDTTCALKCVREIGIGGLR